jgi:hypothetical protein
MNDYREFSDVELCRLLTEGNHAAFIEIHKRYYSLLYRHAYKRKGWEQYYKV